MSSAVTFPKRLAIPAGKKPNTKGANAVPRGEPSLDPARARAGRLAGRRLAWGWRWSLRAPTTVRIHRGPRAACRVVDYGCGWSACTDGGLRRRCRGVARLS